MLKLRGENYSEEEKKLILQEIPKIFKKNKSVWGNLFWSQLRGNILANRSPQSIRNAAKMMSKTSKWDELEKAGIPRAGGVGNNKLVQSTLQYTGITAFTREDSIKILKEIIKSEKTDMAEKEFWEKIKQNAELTTSAVEIRRFFYKVLCKNYKTSGLVPQEIKEMQRIMLTDQNHLGEIETESDDEIEMIDVVVNSNKVVTKDEENNNRAADVAEDDDIDVEGDANDVAKKSKGHIKSKPTSAIFNDDPLYGTEITPVLTQKRPCNNQTEKISSSSNSSICKLPVDPKKVKLEPKEQEDIEDAELLKYYDKIFGNQDTAQNTLAKKRDTNVPCGSASTKNVPGLNQTNKPVTQNASNNSGSTSGAVSVEVGEKQPNNSAKEQLLSIYRKVEGSNGENKSESQCRLLRYLKTCVGNVTKAMKFIIANKYGKDMSDVDEEDMEKSLELICKYHGNQNEELSGLTNCVFKVFVVVRNQMRLIKHLSNCENCKEGVNRLI